MDRLSEIRARCDAAKAQKEKGDSITAACIAWSIVINDIPYLLTEVAALTARAEKAAAERATYKEALAHLEHMVSVERDGNRKREHSIGVVVAIKRARDALKGA